MGVLLDGTNDFYLRGGGLTGAVDSKLGILAYSVRVDNADGQTATLLQDSAGRIQFTRSGANNLRTFCQSAVPATVLNVRTTSTVVSNGQVIRNVLFSWDCASGLSEVYLDDSADKTETTNLDLVIDYTQGNYAVGAAVSGANKLSGVLGFLYFAPGQYLDFSVTANRRLFFRADGSPTNHGTDGSAMTGFVPLVYLTGNRITFPLNLGSGGAFSPDAGASPRSVPYPFQAPSGGRLGYRLGRQPSVL